MLKNHTFCGVLDRDFQRTDCCRSVLNIILLLKSICFSSFSTRACPPQCGCESREPRDSVPDIFQLFCRLHRSSVSHLCERRRRTGSDVTLTEKLADEISCPARDEKPDTFKRKLYFKPKLTEPIDPPPDSQVDTVTPKFDTQQQATR